MEKVSVLVPMLVFLACPLMMVFCLFGMSRLGGGPARGAEPHEPVRNPEERVFVLQRQLQAIQDELAVLQAAETRTHRDETATEGGKSVGVVPGVPDAIQRRA
jgi:hypothetical protein